MKKEIDHSALFEGYQNTPMLWGNDEFYNLKQFHIQNTSAIFIPKSPLKRLRLGKWVEAYASFQLRKQCGIEIIEENIKIFRENQTIGELDLLLFNELKPTHLEIAYKFYLYDHTKVYKDTLAPWIGPNRNDSLLFKIEKLRDKQLPLLYRPETLDILKDIGLDPKDFEQFVCFKAQLFLPYKCAYMNIAPLNENCIQGWHLGFDLMHQLESYKFHIPNKLDWLCKPNLSVNWLDYKSAQEAIKTYIDSKQSPLCWIKNANNDLQKCFITWW